MQKLLLRCVLLLLLCTLVVSAVYAATTNKELDITVTSGATPSITSVSLSNSSFTGGASNGTAVGNITTVTSDGSTPTLTLTGTQTGSGNDATSFQIASGQLQTSTAGTNQPGQYNICIVASGAYSNSPQQTCPTIQATGPGGAGWQLTFSDEFVCPNNMLQCLATYPITSYTWVNSVCSGTSGAAGCGTIVSSSAVAELTIAKCVTASSVSRIGSCSVSINGATNSGAGGNAAVTGTFLVVNVSSDQKTITLYMPYTGITSPMGIVSATIGTGPWTTTIVNSSGSSNPNPTMGWNNNEGERWDAHAVSVNANGLAITTTSAGFTDPTGGVGSSTTGHIQTWGGTFGFSQTRGNGVAFDFYGTPSDDSPSSLSGIWATYWALSDSNIWPGSGTVGGEIDVAEYLQVGTGTCAVRNSYDVDAFDSASGSNGYTASQSSTFTVNGVNHQYTTTNIGGTLSWYLDGAGSPFRTLSGFSSTTDGFYPVVDVEYPSFACGASASLPITTVARYVRVYSKVTSGACYTSIPAHGTTPHTGTC